MDWYPEEDEEDLMFSPALLARRASESWIVEPPVEVASSRSLFQIRFPKNVNIYYFSVGAH